jgi:hypothetical protein
MNTETEEQKDSGELAKDAIDYALQRIRDDENVRYHMGAFTEAFERLKAAHSALTGISEEAIEQDIFGKPLKRKAAAQKLDELKKLVDDHNDTYDDKPQFIEKIKAILY